MTLDNAPDFADLPTDPSVVRRDRLLGALFGLDPEMCLLQHTPGLSLLISPNAPPQIFLLPTRDRDTLRHWPKLLEEIVQVSSGGGPPTHVVAIGGGPPVVQALRDAARSATNVPFGFHHVDDASRLQHVTGAKLEMLEAAAERIKTTEALSAERLRDALVKGRKLAERDRKAVDTLGGQTPVTYALLVACAAVAMFALAKAGSSGYTKLIIPLGATNGSLVRDGEVWRLFASMFLHLSVTHFLMNMLALYNLGMLLEPILGARRFFVLYGLSGLGGALVTTYLSKGHFSAGASGAIWGLMTAVLAIVVFPRGLLPPLLVARLKSSAWRPLVLNVFLSFLPGIDLLAHFGGGFFGFVLVILFLGDGLVPMDERRPGSSPETGPRPLLTAIALVLGAAMALSIGTGMLNVGR